MPYLDWLIEEDIRGNGEYQLTDVLTKIRETNIKIYTTQVDEWLDCGNKDHLLNTHKYYLQKNCTSISENVVITNSKVIEPVYIGDNVIIKNSIVGPYVSIAKDCKIVNCLINNSIIQENTMLEWLCVSDSIISKQVKYLAKPKTLSLGAFCFVEE